MPPTAAASAGVASPAKIVPKTKIIKENNGTKETSTSFKITERLRYVFCSRFWSN